MKNKPLHYCLFLVFLCIYFYLMPGCKKAGSPDEHANGEAMASNNPPAAGPTCSASKADAENIAIFPADNPWNLDVSGAALDPY